MKKQTLNPSRWSLSDLFPAPDSPQLEAALKEAQEKAAAFEKLRPQLTESLAGETFMQIIARLEEISRQVHRVAAYAELWYSEDTQNQSAQALLARVEQFEAELSNLLLFFSLWWKDLPDEAADRLMDGSGDYRYWLEEMRHFKPYTLSEAEEKIINIKDVTGARAINTLYSSLTNHYTFKLTVGRKKRLMTRGELMVYARQADPDLRAAAYQELYRVYGADGPILGQMYQALVRDWRNEQVGLRGYANPIAARNLANDIPGEVVDTLLEICRTNTGLFQRFFRLKARWLGMPRLRRYDVYAPVSHANKHYTFEQARQTVMDAFRTFDASLEAQAQQVFAQQHVDSQVRRGKRGGAFCLTALPDLTPWVLLNFQGRAEDVATMAHELGHAIHSMQAAQHSLFTFHPCLPLAETASTFGEMLLVERLLQDEGDPAVRRDLILRQVDDAYATIQRQAFFCLFEKEAHEMIQQGARIDDLCAAYLQNLKNQFGEAVEVSDEFRWEWVSIPHIYNVPFYVYAYAFGQLLVLSLYRQYRQEGESFKPRYFRILAAGGSVAPVKLLEEAGIDVRQAAFWQGGFDVVRDLIEELEKM